jgi:monothiol glutaredoxin
MTTHIGTSNDLSQKLRNKEFAMTSMTIDGDVQTRIADIVNAHPIVLFMKGQPAQPQCGFSAAVVKVLQRYDVPVHAVDVLADPALRQGIKVYSDWPTIPQLYVDGAFVGGCDIVREMHAAGELETLLTPHRTGAAVS